MRLAGVVALNNSLSFTSENFSRANERDMIMQTVCESTQCSDVKVREKAFECIARISDLYYDKLQPYVDSLFRLTTTTIRTDEPAGTFPLLFNKFISISICFLFFFLLLFLFCVLLLCKFFCVNLIHSLCYISFSANHYSIHIFLLFHFLFSFFIFIFYLHFLFQLVCKL